MRSVGIDLAKASWSAAALAVNGEPDMVALWKPDDPKDSDATKLVGFEKWLVARLFGWQPDIIVVEETTAGGNQNIGAALQIAKREGVALLVAKKRKNVVVISKNIRSSRAVSLAEPGKKTGGLSKEDAFTQFKKLHPTFKLVAKSVGGMDQADAMVHALAGPTHLERRK